MPTYDYECDACGHAFELFQSISEPVKKKCPECGKPKLRRLFGTGAAVVFKGSGFYQTDYRSDSYKKAAEKDKPAGESTGDGKVESKPDAKAESKSTTETKPQADTTKGRKRKPAKPD
jgi:putative FmdB family regulatory protein